MAQINFVRQRVKKLSQLELKDQKIFKIVSIITGIFLIILMGVIGGRLYLLKQIKEAEVTQNSLRQQIKSYEERERAFVIFVNKLKTLSQLFTKRQDKQDAINYFTEVFGPEVVIDQMVYDANEQLLIFGVRAADIFALEESFKILDEAATTDRFAKISRSNLQRTSEAFYRIQVTVVLGEIEE